MISIFLNLGQRSARLSETRRRFSASAGLTLIEMLIVISIIAILAALTLPVISATRKSAQNAMCVSNLKQIGAGVLQFAADYQGKILPCKLSDEVRDREREPGQPRPNAYWDRRLPAEGYIPGPVEEGAALNPALYCPSLMPDGPPTQIHHIYGFRDWRGAKAKPGDYVRLAQIEVPSRFFLLADSIELSGGHQWYAIQSEGGANAVHLRHSGKANTFFADGHVEAMEAEYFQTLSTTQPEFSRRQYRIVDSYGTQL